ncbi:accessory gene regulator B family protein [Clostridium sp. C2-6-12]|uniref:accessory gene regulator ArgB-like protein n=1 Tax=Clostridium sp. C2-6-12 TaxID=2698832 RepID=UPI00136EEDF9|nr:accessory gene regulator B family protein [Clostridium sp. C2-6-12]
MSITEKIAVKMGSKAKSFLNADEDKEQIIIYGAINLLQIIFAILWVIIFSLLLGVPFEALLFSVTTGILRKYSGGVHASSPSRCIIIGTSIACIAGISIDYILYKLSLFTIMWTSVTCIIFAFTVVVKNAPVDSIKKPITNIEVKKQFKKKSITAILFFTGIILILFILSQRYSGLYYIKLIESICLGMLWQAITLTKGGISLVNKVDFVLKYIIEGVKEYGK